MTRLEDHQLFWPTSRAGRWSIDLFVVFALGLLTLAVTRSGQPAGGDWLSVALALGAATAAFASLATAAYAIARHDRSVLLIGCTAIGSLLTLIALG